MEAELRRQSCFHLRPLFIDDAEEDGVADPAARQNQMFAENAFLLCTQTQDSRARLLVEHVGDEFDPIAPPVFEGVREQQQLALSIYRRALRALRQPGVADGGSSIRRSNLVEARGADDFV